MEFRPKKEKHCQYFSPDSTSSILFSNTLNKYITHTKKQKDTLILLCIGTDKITGDCLGPLVGSKLQNPNACILAIDAAVGSKKHIGLISLSCNPLFPGKGVSRPLSPVGQISITGIINEASSSSEILLPYTSLYLVDKLAEYICNGIISAINNKL